LIIVILSLMEGESVLTLVEEEQLQTTRLWPESRPRLADI